MEFINQVSENFCNVTYHLSITKDLLQEVFENTQTWKMGGSSLYFSLFPRSKTAASFSYIIKKRSQLSIQALIIWLRKRPSTELWFRGFRLNFAKKTQSCSAQKGRFTKKSYQIEMGIKNAKWIPHIKKKKIPISLYSANPKAPTASRLKDPSTSIMLTSWQDCPRFKIKGKYSVFSFYLYVL